MTEKFLVSIILIALTYIYCKPAKISHEVPKPILSAMDTHSDALPPSRPLAQEPVRKEVRQPTRNVASSVEHHDNQNVMEPAEEYRSERDHEADSPFVEPGISLEDLNRARALHR